MSIKRESSVKQPVSIPGIAAHRGLLSKVPDDETQAFYDLLPIGILAQDGEGQLLFCNKLARELLDLTEDQIAQRIPLPDQWKLIRPDGTPIPVGQCPTSTALRTGVGTRDQEIGIFHPRAGLYYWASVSVYPVTLPGGKKPALFYSTYIDITSQMIYKKQERERYKELHALVRMNSLLENQTLTCEAFFEQMPAIMAEAWQYPEVTAARITVEGRTYTTPNFRNSEWSQLAHIHSLGVEVGQLEVVYLEKRPFEYEGPFLHEERMLLGAMAERVGKVLERVHLQQRMKVEEKRFRGIVNNMTEGILLLDWNMKYLYLNEAAEAMSRRPAAELLGRAVIDCWPSFVGNPAYDLHLQVLRDREPTTAIGKFAFPNGETRWFHWNIQPASEGLLVLVRDITENIVAQETIAAGEIRIQGLNQSLQEGEQQRAEEYIDLYEHAPVGYHSVNAAGVLTHMNQTELNWLGYTAEEVIGKHRMIEFIAPGSVQTFQENFAEIREGGKILNGEIVFQRKNGTTYVGLVNVHGEFSPDGKFTGIRASVMDITERRSVEESLATSKEELSRANAELMRANRAKDDFLSGMSHEFRTPLTGVIGMAEALEMENLGSLNERQRQALSSLQTSARQLLELVNVTIDYSKLEANRLELVLEDCPILPILTQCMVAAGPVAAGKHQSLILQTGNEDLVIRADTRRVKQMIDQLISNAVKFTPENGSISIRFSADKDANQIAISVQDTGPGIPPEEMNRLYQPFSQLDAGLARKHSGLGLGLALTARLVDLHGGSIRAESAPGGGACFTLRLPLIMRQADSRQLVSGDARGVIAIADDNEAVLMSYADTLREQGFAVITSRNGLEMAHLVKTQRPDVILTDARMPGMDGLALIREIRNQKSAYFKQVPILVMTAYGIPDSRQHFLNAGAIAYFEKPVAVATLLEWIKPLSAARKPHAEK